MKIALLKNALLISLSLVTFSALTSCSEKANATPATTAASAKASADLEKNFIAAFRQALEKHDTKTMDSLLLKDKTPADIVEFYTMMMDLPQGMKIESIELLVPSAEDAAKFNKAMEMPDGKKYKLPIKPTKQLVIVMKEESANGNSSSKSSLPVAEKDGKLIIPLPVAAE